MKYADATLLIVGVLTGAFMIMSGCCRSPGRTRVAEGGIDSRQADRSASPGNGLATGGKRQHPD